MLIDLFHSDVNGGRIMAVITALADADKRISADNE